FPRTGDATAEHRVTKPTLAPQLQSRRASRDTLTPRSFSTVRTLIWLGMSRGRYDQESCNGNDMPKPTRVLVILCTRVFLYIGTFGLRYTERTGSAAQSSLAVFDRENTMHSRSPDTEMLVTR